MTAIPRHIDSKTAFASSYREYLLKDWSVLPLPPNKKSSPPTGYTGRAGKFAEDRDIEEWLHSDKWAKGNIAIRAGNQIIMDGKSYEAMGIDVDNYGRKQGRRELAVLEKDLEPLPDTWISSARSDGTSGIRWYLTPYGYEFRGKASDSIEIVQRVHRYGVVFPSWNPDARAQYYWYERGNRPDGKHFTWQIPQAKWLEILPDSWFNFLTRHGLMAIGPMPIDMEINTSDLYAWAEDEFVDGYTPCGHMRRAVDKCLYDITQGSDHHAPLTESHWFLLHLGAEGHKGWLAAVKTVEKAWLTRIVEEGSGSNRSLREAKAELRRSREGTLRKIKGAVNEDS